MKSIRITKKKLLILLGILVALSPFLGLPVLAKSAIAVILGLSVALTAFVSGPGKLCECDNCVPKSKPGSYVENAPVAGDDKDNKKPNNNTPPIRI